MKPRLSLIAALLSGVGALVMALVFGSEPFVREVALERRSDGNFGVVASVLAAPSWGERGLGFGSDALVRFSFLVVFPVAVALLVLATVRRGNGFVAGWTAAVAAGAVAGFTRGLLLDDRFGYYGNGNTKLGPAFLVAGSGASFGLLLGWGIGILALLGGLLSSRSTTTTTPTEPAVTGERPAWAPVPQYGDGTTVMPSTPADPSAQPTERGPGSTEAPNPPSDPSSPPPTPPSGDARPGWDRPPPVP